MSEPRTEAGKALSNMGPAFAGGMTVTQFDEYLWAVEAEARADEQSKSHTFDGGNPCEICAEAVKPYIAFVREFVSWADDGEGDDDGLISKARALLAANS